MKTWSIKVASNHFGAMLANCETTGPQVLTRRGTPTAVLVSIAEWERLNAKKPLTLKELLLSNKHTRGDIKLPPRAIGF
jgi:prevent-host-death family protein